jgi:hypothetical protein
VVDPTSPPVAGIAGIADRTAGDPALADATVSARGGGDHEAAVAVVRWPAEADRRDELAGVGRARLLVLADGELPPPPLCDGLEDWVREGGDPLEVFVRTERLRERQAARAPATLDADGILRRGRWWVALSERDLQVAGVLLARPGAIVARSAVLHAVDPGAERDEHRLVDTVVRRFQRRVAPLGLVVHTVRRAGFLVEQGKLPLV